MSGGRGVFRSFYSVLSNEVDFWINFFICILKGKKEETNFICGFYRSRKVKYVLALLVDMVFVILMRKFIIRDKIEKEVILFFFVVFVFCFTGKLVVYDVIVLGF